MRSVLCVLVCVLVCVMVCVMVCLCGEDSPICVCVSIGYSARRLWSVILVVGERADEYFTRNGPNWLRRVAVCVTFEVIDASAHFQL